MKINVIENIYKGIISSLLGTGAMVYAGYGWHVDELTNKEAGLVFFIGFLLLFVRHKLEEIVSGGLGKLFDAIMNKFFGGNKTPILALLLLSSFAVNAQYHNVKGVRVINDNDSTLISGVGQIRWDAATGKFRFGNGTNWISFRNSADAIGVTDGDKGDITVSSSGTVWTIDNAILSNVASGTYSPTFSVGSNLDATPAATANTAKYTRIGNIVTVMLYANVDLTVAGAYSFTITLPIASNIGAASDLLGVGGDATLDGVEVVGDLTNDRATVTATSTSTANHGVYITFTYKVI